MALGIAYFGANGYTVSIPLNDTLWYDFIAEKDGKFYTVLCKATGSQDNVIALKSCGGTQGSAYDNVLNHPLDFLFCVDKNLNMFVIPMSKIRECGNTKQITLRTVPQSNLSRSKLDTSNFIVTI